MAYVTNFDIKYANTAHTLNVHLRNCAECFQVVCIVVIGRASRPDRAYAFSST